LFVSLSLKLTVIDSDNKEDKTGFSKACNALNTVLSTFLKDKDLYISKKTCYNVEDWIDREKEKIERKEKMEQNTSRDTEVKETTSTELPMEINPFVIRCALEAMHFAYGSLVCP
jgi:hypothetical protein